MALKNAGYTDLIEKYLGASAYSYLFDGQVGYLDHALGTPSIVSQVTGVAEWHVNADEVPLFDYNDDVADAGESSFERESNALPLYEPGPRRSSDHDPLVIGLNLDDPSGPAFAAVAPVRLLDTRPAEPPGLIPVAKQRVGGDEDPARQGHGRRRSPATGVEAVALNVTVVDPTGDGFITVYPCGTVRSRRTSTTSRARSSRTWWSLRCRQTARCASSRSSTPTSSLTSAAGSQPARRSER